VRSGGDLCVMRSNDTLLKLRRFEVNEKHQKVIEIETMIADFQRMIDDLSHQIEVEEETSRIRDVNHFSYPPYAKAARKRRDNLRSSIESLEAKAQEARADLAEAQEELRKTEMVEERSLIDHDRGGVKSHGRETVAVGASHLFNSRA
jgi:flagellar FliJ protein